MTKHNTHGGMGKSELRKWDWERWRSGQKLPLSRGDALSIVEFFFLFRSGQQFVKWILFRWTNAGNSAIYVNFRVDKRHEGWDVNTKKNMERTSNETNVSSRGKKKGNLCINFCTVFATRNSRREGNSEEPLVTIGELLKSESKYNFSSSRVR